MFKSIEVEITQYDHSYFPHVREAAEKEKNCSYLCTPSKATACNTILRREEGVTAKTIIYRVRVSLFGS